MVLILTLMGAEAFAERFRFQWGAQLSVKEQYDDNIYLNLVDKEYDWITFLTPGLKLSLVREELPEASLIYEFSLAQYARNNDRSTVRHRLSLSGFRGIEIAKRVTLDLDDTFLISEDPLGSEEDFPSPSVRRGRRRWYRNVFDGKVNYLFGPEDLVYVGFAHTFLSNEDPRYEDSQGFRPSAGLNYWLTLRWGFLLDYYYGNVKYEPSDVPQREMDDYQSHLGVTTLRYRANPRTEVDLSYSYNKLDYEGPRIGYDVHRATLGLSHEFSAQISASLSGGCFILVPEEGDTRAEPTGSLLITRTTPRSTFTLDGTAGYRRQAFQARNLGLSFFGRALVTFRYQLQERLSTVITGAYFRDEYQETLPKRVETNWRGTAALDYTILRWLSGGLRYEYRLRLSDQEVNEFVDNRVTLTFTASHLSKPKPF
jgi:hypothetical protein